MYVALDTSSCDKNNELNLQFKTLWFGAVTRLARSVGWWGFRRTPKDKKSSTWKQFDTVITGQELQANKCPVKFAFLFDNDKLVFLVLCLQQKKKPVGVLSEAWKLESSTCVNFHSLVSSDKFYSLSLGKVLGLDNEYSFVGIQCLEPIIYMCTFHTHNSMTHSNLAKLNSLTHWQSFLLVVPYLMHSPAMVLR